jgi:hypothetical protein
LKRKARLSNKILLFVSVTIILAIGSVLGMLDYRSRITTTTLNRGSAKWSQRLGSKGGEFKSSHFKLREPNANDEQIAEEIQYADNLEDIAKNVLDSQKQIL